MRIAQSPLSEQETVELAQLLEDVAGRTLAFARGLFAAVATAPATLEPTEWVPHLLGQSPPDKASLDRMFSLLIREYQACAECLALNVPTVPHPDAEDEVIEFCKGYVRLMQSVPRWTRDADAFALSVPFAVLAGYVGADALARVDPAAAAEPEVWRAARYASLADDVAALYAYWAEARAKLLAESKVTPVQVAAKVGRNDACPCGSGKKFKKCCAS